MIPTSNNYGITLIYIHVLLGMQEAAVEKFDSIFDTGLTENSDANFSKMLANSEDLASRPCRSRTCDTLIKSLGVVFSAPEPNFESDNLSVFTPV